MERAALARVKKKAEEEKRTIVFVDQSAFYLLPMAVRTYAPVGKTPVLKVKLTRDHRIAQWAALPLEEGSSCRPKTILTRGLMWFAFCRYSPVRSPVNCWSSGM